MLTTGLEHHSCEEDAEKLSGAFVSVLFEKYEGACVRHE